MKRTWPAVILVVAGALLILGIVELFVLRFEVGDVYPEYSSLRSDPLGTMALYESLEAIAGLHLERDISISNRLPDGNDAAYFHIAAPVVEWTKLTKETLAEVERFVAAGGRFVVTLRPDSLRGSQAKPESVKTEGAPENQWT